MMADQSPLRVQPSESCLPLWRNEWMVADVEMLHLIIHNRCPNASRPSLFLYVSLLLPSLLFSFSLSFSLSLTPSHSHWAAEVEAGSVD